MNVMKNGGYQPISSRFGKRGRGNLNNNNRTFERYPLVTKSLKLSTQKTPRYSLEPGSRPLPTLSSKPRSVPFSSVNRDVSNRGNITISSLSRNPGSSVTPRYRFRNATKSGSGAHPTPGSIASTATIPSSLYILAISEGRGAARGEVGIAAIDLRRLHLSLSQISDSHSYIQSLTKIHFYNPVEIIVPHTFSSGMIPTELYKLIKDHFPKIALTSVPRRQFSNNEALQHIHQLCAPEYETVSMLIMHKFYALTSASAVLKYVEQIQCITFAPKSLIIEYHASENFALIDVETAQKLELVEPISENFQRGSSLLSILNYTSTLGGLRNLRANILQPLCDLKVINARLDCIKELKENNDGISSALENILKQLFDVEKILWLCVSIPIEDGSRAGEAQLNNMLLLKTSMDLVPNIIDALKSAQNVTLRKIKKELENPRYEEILTRIKTVLQENVHAARGAAAHIQRCYAVKPEINGLLDVARRTYSELIAQIEEKVADLSESHNLPLRLHCTVTKGFHIIMPIPRGKSGFQTNELPNVFLDVQHLGSCVSMTTEDIILLNQQTKESLNEIHTMSNIVISNLLNELRPYMGSLYKLCEHIGELDLMLSLTKACLSQHYVRPNFGNNLDLVSSYHPMLDFLLPTCPIPNNVFASSEYNFHIVTGPNMGGKTIYIKQIALLQIMAQVGCYVPAKKATFRIADHIFSRLSFNDSIELNASTFVLEMKEIDYILKNMTPNSLIIIDELCRSTSSEEGASLAWAVSEKLLNSEAFTFFTTHFLYLTKLQEIYLNVTNLHTETEEKLINGLNHKKLIYKHRILPGVTPIEMYGLALAKNTNLPPKVVDLAEELAAVIGKYKNPVVFSNQIISWYATVHKFVSDLKRKMADANTSDETIESMVMNFKEENREKIDNLVMTDVFEENEILPDEIEKVLQELEASEVEPPDNDQENDLESLKSLTQLEISEDNVDVSSLIDEYKKLSNCEIKSEILSQSSNSSLEYISDRYSRRSNSSESSKSIKSIISQSEQLLRIKKENHSDSCWILEPSVQLLESEPPTKFNFSSFMKKLSDSSLDSEASYKSEHDDVLVSCKQYLQDVMEVDCGSQH